MSLARPLAVCRFVRRFVRRFVHLFVCVCPSVRVSVVKWSCFVRRDVVRRPTKRSFDGAQFGVCSRAFESVPMRSNAFQGARRPIRWLAGSLTGWWIDFIIHRSTCCVSPTRSLVRSAGVSLNSCDELTAKRLAIGQGNVIQVVVGQSNQINLNSVALYPTPCEPTQSNAIQRNR